MTDSTMQHIAARDDHDLTARLIAKAEQKGLFNAEAAVRNEIGRLVSAEITVGGQQTTITTVHAYAAAVREEYLSDTRAMPPGLNPGAVTDDILDAALQALFPNLAE